MLDDLDPGERAHVVHMREASNVLSACIARARAGLPTGSPDGLALRVSADPPPRAWNSVEIAKMKEMRGRGCTIGQIALAIGRSRESVKDGVRRHLRGFDRRGNKVGQ